MQPGEIVICENVKGKAAIEGKLENGSLSGEFEAGNTIQNMGQ
jgi:hypothetical protein